VAVHSSNIWAKSPANGSLTIVLQSRFSPTMPVGPAIFKLVSHINIIFGSNVSKILAIDPKMMTIDPKMMMIDPKRMTIDPNMMTIDPNLMTIDPNLMTIDPKRMMIDLNMMMIDLNWMLL